MIDPALAAELAERRAAYHGRAIPAVLVPDAISETRAAALRALADAAPFERFDLAHRGRYAALRSLRDAELEASLATLVEHLAGEALELERVVWTRLGHGDYALAKDDDPPDHRAIELVLDLSPRASGEADVVYARASGAVVFAAPQTPCSLAVVERAPGVRRYERYLTHRVGDLVVTRLRAQLRFV